jgi:hypothetical protein
VLAWAHASVLHDAIGGSDVTGKDGTKFLIDVPVPKGFSFWESYQPASGFDRLRKPSGPILFKAKAPNFT